MEKLDCIGKLAEWIVPTAVAIAAFVKYCLNSRDRHAKAMLELMREFQRDHADAFYSLVERKDSEFYRGSLTFDNSENERKADAMLLFLENVLHLFNKGTISDSEFVHFEYYLKRIISDPDFARYLHDFSLACSAGDAINPFAHILDYCRLHAVFKLFGQANLDVDNRSCGYLETDGDRNDARAASEAVFTDYLTRYYHGMTRTAKSVKSRIDNHLSKKGWSYEKAPTQGDLLKAIQSVGVDVLDRNTAASVKAALRQYFRASFGKEPNV